MKNDVAWRHSIVVVTVDNDAESRLIRYLAHRASMTVIRSEQGPGAQLHLEPDIVARIQKTGLGTVWTVEIPGPEIEEELRALGYAVVCIDHHTYGELDRTKDPVTGQRVLSSLEQFLALAEIDDDELHSWGTNPRLVRGIGIFDDRFRRGLVAAGYSSEEVLSVLRLRADLQLELHEDFIAARAAAESAWSVRTVAGSVLIVRSDAPHRINAEVGVFSILDGVDEMPLLVSQLGGGEYMVNNVHPDLVARLETRFTLERSTFTYGYGRCWGVNNTRRPPEQQVTFDEVLTEAVLFHG